MQEEWLPVCIYSRHNDNSFSLTHFSLNDEIVCDDFMSIPVSKVHGANMGPTWVLSAPAGPHVGPMHICVSKPTTIGSDNGLSPGRRQAIIWTSAGILLIGPLETNFSEVSIRIQTFSFKKMHLKVLSAKWHPFVSPQCGNECYQLVFTPSSFSQTEWWSQVPHVWFLSMLPIMHPAKVQWGRKRTHFSLFTLTYFISQFDTWFLWSVAKQQCEYIEEPLSCWYCYICYYQKGSKCLNTPLSF